MTAKSQMTLTLLNRQSKYYTFAHFLRGARLKDIMTGSSSNINSSNTSNNPPDDRPPSPTEVASPDHPSGCTCGCLHTGFPKHCFRNYHGTEVYTGILCMASPLENSDSNDLYFKLNDPNYQNFKIGDTIEDLSGHGHVMTNEECTLEMSQYDDASTDIMAMIKNATPFLKDFADKPQDFEIKQQEIERFSSIFPHGTPGPRGWIIPEIRARDSVKVIVHKIIPQFRMMAAERIWVDIVAVPNETGMLVGTINSSIDNPFIISKNFPLDMSPDPNFDLHEDDLVTFPVTCAYGVTHGDNW